MMTDKVGLSKNLNTLISNTKINQRQMIYTEEISCKMFAFRLNDYIFNKPDIVRLMIQ